ncbi:MAG TPA: hypothetical protein GXX18_02775 [Bacillales bacterium]|nr:hypothetical protein [Bacillales bacterium]
MTSLIGDIVEIVPAISQHAKSKEVDLYDYVIVTKERIRSCSEEKM